MAKPNVKMILGVTGPSGAGKSEACQAVAKEGFTVINVDKLAKSLYKKGNPGYDRLKRLFGAAILGPGGRISRPALGVLVFKSKAARQKLNKALFPLIYKAVQERILLKQRLGKRKICLDMAVLFQTGAWTLCDRVLLVDDQLSRRIRRLVRRGVDPRRAAGQAKALKINRRDRKRSTVLRNTGSLADFRRRARAFAREVLSR